MRGCRSICITGRCESPCDDMERYREEQEGCEVEHEPEPDERPGDGGGRACSSGTCVLLARVREAWPHPVEVPFARYNSRQARWECWVWPVDLPHRPPRCYTGATEPECLIAALEGAGDDMTVHETLQ